ncbi:MAG TPA: hypothetical protein ENK04_13800 [Gammaproteobacteria bacterium]|nr:hypothetical protein [Gammaproteobacteria bacterium]
MTSVTMVTSDDAALHTRKTNSRNVKETQAYPTSQPVKAHENAPHTPQQKIKRNQRQRRKQERRQQQKSVLLDTRSGHDRRNIKNTETVTTENNSNEQPAAGIDIYV